MIKTTLKLAAPYLAVLVFWLFFRNAWLTILAYHAQILFWTRASFKELFKGFNVQGFLIFAVPCLSTGFIAYFLLPFMYPEAALASWYSDYKLEDFALILMLPYFGFIHPPLEQLHWAPLRQDLGMTAHLCFAGYHAFVLSGLLYNTWLVFSLLILITVSILWTYLYKCYRGLTIPALTHVFADTGIITAAYFLI